MIVIIDYGLGNIKAFSNILQRKNFDFRIAKNEEDLKGGESILVDGVEVFKRQSQADKDILKSIHLMEHCVFEGDLTQHPMVFEDRDNLSLYYSFWMAEGLSDLQRNAFDSFTKSVMETEPKKFKLPQNWCLVINNRRIFHGRTALSDNSNRFLKRYWISSSKLSSNSNIIS